MLKTDISLSGYWYVILTYFYAPFLVEMDYFSKINLLNCSMYPFLSVVRPLQKFISSL
jgi:hypothetical protein